MRTALAPVRNALGIEDAPEDVVAHAGQILDPAATDHDYRMLLEIMAFAWNITNDFLLVG